MSLTGSAADRPRALRIAVTSGKGGVGKTCLAINLAIGLARLGHRTGLVDADFALGNVDVMLGLTPEHHLGGVLDGARTLGDVMLDGPSGVRVIPAGSGVRALTALEPAVWSRLVAALDEAGRDLDFLVIDTATGISDAVLDVVGLADYVLVVTSSDPAAVVDAYAVIKLLTVTDRTRPIGVVVNATRDADEAHRVFRQIALAAERFLGRGLRYDGHVVEDAAFREALAAQAPLVAQAPASPAGRCLRRLASRVAAARPAGTSPWPSAPRPVTAPAEAGMEAPRCA